MNLDKAIAIACYWEENPIEGRMMTEETKRAFDLLLINHIDIKEYLNNHKNKKHELEKETSTNVCSCNGSLLCDSIGVSNFMELPAESVLFKIGDYVCKQYKTTLKHIHVKSRVPYIVQARQTIGYFLFKKRMATLKEIGYLINQDHSTVIHSCKTVTNEIDTQSVFGKKVLAMYDDIEVIILEASMPTFNNFSL